MDEEAGDFVGDFFGGGGDDNNIGEDGPITTVEHDSFGERMKGACGKVIFGIVAFVAGIILLILNERNAVKSYKAVNEASKNVISLTAIDTIDPANEGKLVHLYGMARAGSNVTDSTFGIEQEDILLLKRTTEMYQWKETKNTKTKKNTGGSTTTSTTYSYNKIWSSSRIPSESFQQSSSHRNPSDLPVGSFSDQADPITLGAFLLGESVSSHFSSWYEPLNNFDFDVATLDASVQTISGNRTAVVWPTNEGYYYGGGTPSSSQIGDVRVSFSIVPTIDVSIVARQTGSTFTEYTVSNGRKILYVEKGIVSADEMLENAKRSIKLRTWLLRAAGFAIMWLGLSMVTDPLEVFADIIPCFGNLVTGITCTISGLVAGVIAIIVIALSWLLFRPFIALPFLVLIGGGVFYYYFYHRKQNDNNNNNEKSLGAVDDDSGGEKSDRETEEDEQQFQARGGLDLSESSDNEEYEA